MTWADAMRLYGSDKPDLRVKLEFTELTDVMRDVDFKVFSGPALMEDGRVVALRVPGGSEMSRGEIDAYTEFVKIYGAKGLAWIKVNDVTKGREGLQSPVVKNLHDAALTEILKRSGAANGERRTGQTASVGQRSGAAMIPISAERAQPARDAPTTLEQCRRCELWQHATQAVPGVGPQTARIMLVGEQPGDQEDLAGLPFVGPAGALLEQALREAGVARDSLYLTNAVKHFKWEPRGKRRLHKTPAQREILACHGWLEEEIERVQPQVIVALGSTALKSIMQDGAASMTPLLGTPAQYDGRWVVSVYHPAYVLRALDEASRRQAYRVIVEGLRQALTLLQD